MLIQTVVVNRCFGGFGLSEEAIRLFNERSPDLKIALRQRVYAIAGEGEILDSEVPRDHPTLIEVVRTLGPARASDKSADLRLWDVHIEFELNDHDGMEHPKAIGWSEEVPLARCGHYYGPHDCNHMASPEGGPCACQTDPRKRK